MTPVVVVLSLAAGAPPAPAVATALSAQPKPPVAKQLAELVGSDTAAGDVFGFSIAVSGSTVVADAFGHVSSAGRAYVFGV
jgi:hypothetical protein